MSKSFSTVLREVLDRAIWGIDFFMLADRDAVPADADPDQLAITSNGRFRALSKYHLENYFLDTQVLARVFGDMEPGESWLRDAEAIDQVLREIAKSQVSYAAALIASKNARDIAGNVDIMPKGCQGKSIDELQQLFSTSVKNESARVTSALDSGAVSDHIKIIHNKLIESLESSDEGWRADIPGKPIFRIFCNRAGLSEGRLKSLYIRKAEEVDPSPFDELVQIFESFASIQRNDV